MAEAAYAAYGPEYGRRSWEGLHAHERFRWLLAAHALQERPSLTEGQVRAVYMIGIASNPWDELSIVRKAVWMRVHKAMLRAVESKQVAA
jgi:hypothetical protein